jgi:site-specific recombinase
VFDVIWQRRTGGTFLDPDSAHAVVASFDPLGSGTVPFAALTGVLLWISSLAAGWFENWIVYRRLPEAIEHHRLGKRLGRRNMARAARFLERQAAGFGGSVALGFLLGMIPAFAKFFGLPIDVRHITLSTGSLTLAISSLGIAGVAWTAVAAAVAGIAVIGLLNFGVSFALALVVALRARDVPKGERRTLPGAVLRRFVRRPLEFFYPPSDSATLDGHASHARHAPSDSPAPSEPHAPPTSDASPDPQTPLAGSPSDPHTPLAGSPSDPHTPLAGVPPEDQR